ncbi:MAG: metalloregulator ArsR/SmtB family transcription factor [Chitinophagales bacterium]|nr:metalloregulator ArsR/SmtB family transcription factor [Chitinophagales bacterium]
MALKSHAAFELDKTIKANKILIALCHPLRIRMLNFIAERGKVNVGTIHKSLNLDQSIASQQLRILRDAQLVYTERSGKEVIYSVNTSKLKRIHKILQRHIKI